MYERHGRCVIAVSEGIHDAAGPAHARGAGQGPAGRPGARTATCSCRAAVRWPTCCARRSRASSRSSACAATPSATCSAASSAASATWISAKRAKSAKRPCSTPCGAKPMARWPSSAPASIRWTTTCCRCKPWPARHASWKTSSSAPAGTDVTDAFRLYLRPLLGSGMPDAFRLRPHPVPKVLKIAGREGLSSGPAPSGQPPTPAYRVLGRRGRDWRLEVVGQRLQVGLCIALEHLHHGHAGVAARGRPG
jgi:hypothetical protein